MKTRLLLDAGWPFLLVLMLVIGIFIHTVVINIRRLEKKDALSKFLSRSLNAVIIVFYLVLPSVCGGIFDAKKCRSFVSNDVKIESESYLIADFSLECGHGDANYEEVQRVFWSLFAIWPVAVPLVFFVLTMHIRPSHP